MMTPIPMDPMPGPVPPGAQASPSARREAGWVTRLFQQEAYTAEYQQLKFSLHNKLLNRVNLEALSSISGDKARAEIRAAVARLVDEEKTALSLVAKDRVVA